MLNADNVRYVYNYKIMSKARIGMFVTELLVMITNTGLTITLEVMKQNIIDLYNKFKPEIDLINSINGLLETVSFH
jgi:hypothetical protein